MPSPDAGDGVAVVAVHDVSPATFRECRELFAMLAHCDVRCASLLVIPDYHRHAPVLFDRRFQNALEARGAAGDELVLHGMFHLDEAVPPRTPRGFVERRLLTRAEGEFAALTAEEAAPRIDSGLALFDALGWPLAGFVPPAWLMSEGTRAAIETRAHRFSYVSVRAGIYRLPEWRFVRTANLCYSPTSVARRAYSRFAVARALERARPETLLRITLHPQDAREPSVMRHWERVIRKVAVTRRLTTKRDWIAQFRQPTAPVPLQAHGEPRALEYGAASSQAAPPAIS